MNYTDILSLIGGLCLFLFGMQVMGESLEKRAGGRLSGLIAKLTAGRMSGFITGLGVTAVMQSSSATTVMVVGFVNSGVMTLKQAINVIMGANVGTTVTAWLLSLTGIKGSNPFVVMLKPTNFTPILAFIGIILFMTSKSDRKKDVGTILLGFATLMIGMDIMSRSVAGLKEVPEFGNLLLEFSNPVFGVVAGALLTAIIQSSSASVGILQALSATGQVTVGAAIPIILGQNIGTCVTALIASVGVNKNAKRASVVHLCFNIIGCALWLSVFYIANMFFEFAFVSLPVDAFSIAVIHTVFNVACSLCMLPAAGLLEKLAFRLVPEGSREDEMDSILDERLLATPAFAVSRCRAVSVEMAEKARESFYESLKTFKEFDEKIVDKVRELENITDKYEDRLGSYLVKLSAKPMSVSDSNEAAEILHMIGDFERISDHAVNLAEAAREMNDKEIAFSEQAEAELSVLVGAVSEIIDISFGAYAGDNPSLAERVEPLEQVIDSLKEQIRSRHIIRLRAGDCSLDLGFVLSDVLTDLERIADHCSNIAGCIIEMRHSELDLHEYLTKRVPDESRFRERFSEMMSKYALPKS